MTIKVNFKNSLGIAGSISVRKQSSFDEVYNLLANYYEGVKITSVERIKDTSQSFNHCFGSTLLNDCKTPLELIKMNSYE